MQCLVVFPAKELPDQGLGIVRMVEIAPRVAAHFAGQADQGATPECRVHCSVCLGGLRMAQAPTLLRSEEPGGVALHFRALPN